MSGPNVVIVVPWRDRGDEHRRANFMHVMNWLLDADIGEVLVCDDGRDRGPFNRSAAYNAGRNHRPAAKAYIWHEADMVVPHIQLAEAVRMSKAFTGLVVPFHTYSYLSEADSARVLDGTPLRSVGPAEYEMAQGRAVGAVGVTSDVTMRAVGGWDETFEGWGFDDRAMARAFQVCCRATRYAPGYGHHLWHPPAWSRDDPSFRGGSEGISYDEQAATAANKTRFDRYLAARSPDQIRALTTRR